MLEQFMQENDLNDKLSKYTDAQLNQLYLRLFNTDDGRLILRDLANRCFINKPLSDGGWSQESLMQSEGTRLSYLSIVTRMKKAVTKQGGSDEES